MVFIVNAFLQIPSYSVRAKQKEVENEEKTIDAPPPPKKKAEVNGNMDCFSLIKDQWKLFKGQWKVRENSGNF